MRAYATISACLIVALTSLAADVELMHRPRQTNPDIKGHPRFVVDDPDAHKGTAQAAIPGKSHPGGPICSFYSYARPAGIYRIIWRVKVDDNMIDEPVFKASTGGGRKHKGGSITLKGTDFKESNVYQEFSYTASKGEGGFFGVSASWPGKGQVHVDHIKVVSEKLFTDHDLAGNVELPREWIFPTPPPLTIHIAKGLWWDFFGLREAVPEMGGGFITSSYHTSGQRGKGLRGFPGSWQKMAEHNLIILANVDAPSLRPRGRVLIEEYVKGGGALLILGGPFAFEHGGYSHTSLENILPCRLSGKRRHNSKDGLVLTPTKGAGRILPGDLAWSMSPRVYYYHDVEPLDGAQILATADGKPMIIVSQIGKGRVGVVAATVEGDPSPDQLPFWEWGDMPRLMASVCQWLVSSPRSTPIRTIDAKSRALLEELSVPAPANEDVLRQRLLADLLAKCNGKVFATEIMTAVSAYTGSPDRRFVEAVAGAIRPYVDTSFEKVANELIDTEDAGKADLGIRVLGICHPKGIAPRMKRFLHEGLGSLSEDDDDDLDLDGLMMGPGGGMGADNRIKLAAIVALGDLGDISFVPALKNLTPQFARKRQSLLEITEVSNLNEDIYQQSLAARCKLGDNTAVAPFLQAIIKNEDYIQEFRNVLSTMLVNKDDKAMMRKRKVSGIRLPVLLRRQTSHMTAMRAVPFSVAGQIANALVRNNNQILIPYAYAALTPHASRQLTPDVVTDVLPLLEKCELSVLRLLAFRLAAQVDDRDVNRRLVDTVVRLASSPESTSALFALRRASQLPAKGRLAVVTAALKHPDDDIRRLARLSLPLLSERERDSLAVGE